MNPVVKATALSSSNNVNDNDNDKDKEDEPQDVYGNHDAIMEAQRFASKKSPFGATSPAQANTEAREVSPVKSTMSPAGEKAGVHYPASEDPEENYEEMEMAGQSQSQAPDDVYANEHQEAPEAEYYNEEPEYQNYSFQR